MKKEVIAIGIGAIVVLGSLTYILLQPEMTVNENQIIEKAAVLEEIERDKDKIISKDYIEAPNNLWFRTNELLTYHGNHQVYGDSQYLLSIESLTLEKVSDGSVEETMMNGKGERLIANIDGKGLFVKKLDGDLLALVLRGEDDFYITETLAVDDKEQPCVKVAKDLSKLVYLREDGMIYTYHFAKNRFKKINKLVDANDFLSDLSLSDDGGYICIDSMTPEAKNRWFDVFGADSGTKYGEAIMGFSPTFSGDHERIYYLYTGDIEEGAVDGKRLGRYDFGARKFSYIDRESDLSIYPTLLPIGKENLLYFVGERQGSSFKVTTMKEYNFSDGTITIKPGFEGLLIDQTMSVDLLGEMMIFTTDDGIVNLYDTSTNTLRALGKLDPFVASGKTVEYVKTDRGFYVTIANRVYLINVHDKQLVYEGMGEVMELSISSQEDKMAIVEKNDDAYNIVVVYLE